MIKAIRETAVLSVAQPVDVSRIDAARFAANCGNPAGPYTIGPMTPT